MKMLGPQLTDDLLDPDGGLPDGVGVAPAPGTGVLRVGLLELGTDVWFAAWQGRPGYLVVEGGREEVIAWAQEQPAAQKWLAHPRNGEDNWQPLPAG